MRRALLVLPLVVAAACHHPMPSTSSGTAPDTSASTQAVASRVYSEAEVTTKAYIITGVPPRYPQKYLETGQAGRVVAEFVVDTAGRAEMRSFVAIRVTGGDEFSEAVRRVLSRFVFAPATIGDRKVRQRVRMPFEFSTG